MGTYKSVIRDLYYTNGHEWIDFQGTVAYIGVANFKVSKINEIQKIRFRKPRGFVKQGEVLAIIHGKNCKVLVHMPIDGKILNVNDMQLLPDQMILRAQPENDRWLALIGLSQPYERKGLMRPGDYKLFIKRKN